jgi:hypothetical protein
MMDKQPPVSERTVTSIASSHSLTLSTINPLGTRDESSKLDAMALIPPLESTQGTSDFHQK